MLILVSSFPFFMDSRTECSTSWTQELRVNTCTDRRTYEQSTGGTYYARTTRTVPGIAILCTQSVSYMLDTSKRSTQ
jgi:hypothetical protein